MSDIDKNLEVQEDSTKENSDIEQEKVATEDTQDIVSDNKKEVQPKKVEKEEEKTLSDNKALNKKLKWIFILIIGVVLLWIFIINPFITFKFNEKSFTKAAEQYFSVYTQELPTGERIGEVSLQTLYNKGYIEKDYLVSYNLLTRQTCSVTDSWVKVKNVDGEYKYYTYLECGLLKSKVDHIGPKILLNGDKNMTVSLGDTYTDSGVESIVDNVDGSMDKSKVTIEGEVDTNTVGKYEITYTASDSLKNISTVTRVINVVQKLNSTVKKNTDSLGYYMGDNVSNYIKFSGMLFRIVDIDGDNVRIIADKDVSNVNYDGIDKWLDYYYDHINEESKKLIVKNKYCKMNVLESDTNLTECSHYTEKKNVYIASIVDVNKSLVNGASFLKPYTMSWLADTLDTDNSYLTKYLFYNANYGKNYLAYPNKYNFGVRPILTIKGDTLIVEGDGTEENPYSLGDFKVGKPDDKINTRQSGEYISLAGRLWRIQETLDDGTTKVISEFSLSEKGKYLDVNYDSSIKEQAYNPTKKGNVAYKINNLSSEYVDVKYFVKHEIEVPIYKEDALYQKEVKVEKYKVKVSAPNMYEMFSASSGDNLLKSYWLLNSSQREDLKYGVSDTGIVYFGENISDISLGIRPVGYLHKNCSIVSGSGTHEDPYIVEK